MSPTPRLAARIAPYLEPGERVVWADRPRHALLLRMGIPPRTPTALLGGALLVSGVAFGVGLAITLAPQPARAALVFGLGLLVAVVAVVLAWKRPARSIYAASDRGRGFLLTRERTIAFPLPERIEVQASADLETGDLDLGPLAVTRLPGTTTETHAVRLRAVAYPRIVADLLQNLATAPVEAARAESARTTRIEGAT
jgi:hypothetical protein